MLSLECKSCFIVIKLVQISCFSPSGLVVAIHTFATKFSIVDILVTALAILGLYAQAILKYVDRGCKVHFMTFTAIHFLVFAFQGKMGFAVIEFL